MDASTGMSDLLWHCPLLKFMHPGLVSFPAGLVPVGFDSLFLFIHHHFRFFSEYGICRLLPLYFCQDRARNCTNHLARAGLSWSDVCSLR